MAGGVLLDHAEDLDLAVDKLAGQAMVRLVELLVETLALGADVVHRAEAPQPNLGAKLRGHSRVKPLSGEA